MINQNHAHHCQAPDAVACRATSTHLEREANERKAGNGSTASLACESGGCSLAANPWGNRHTLLNQ